MSGRALLVRRKSLGGAVAGGGDFFGGGGGAPIVMYVGITLSHQLVALGVVFGDRAKQRGLLADQVAVADHHDLGVR
jgi:hypothetical protein